MQSKARYTTSHYAHSIFTLSLTQSDSLNVYFIKYGQIQVIKKAG